ncbi:MAG: GNAT family N-acetyltransferase [Patescibacteria group bacterium]
MQLQQVSLRGRRFLIQFGEIIREFGGVIPWLDGIENLGYATNGVYFRDQLLRRLGQEEEGVTAYQFVLSGSGRKFLGGLLQFQRTPERFKDSRNNDSVSRLVYRGSTFISCLQVRPTHRGDGVGDELMRRTLKTLLREKGSVWGVVSDPRLLSWYKTLGARILSPLENQDGLWIVHWSCTEAPVTG